MMFDENRIKTRYNPLLLMTIVLFGFNVPVLKYSVTLVHPFLLNLYRFFLGTIVQVGFYLYDCRQRDMSTWRPMLGYWKENLLVGLTGNFLPPVLLVVALRYTTATNVVLIAATTTLWTAVSSRLLGLERLSYRAWSAIVVSLVGSVFLAVSGKAGLSPGSERLFGNVLVFLTSVVGGVSVSLKRHFMNRRSYLAVGSGGMLFSFPLFLGLAIGWGTYPSMNVFRVPDFYCVFFLGFVVLGLGMVFWNKTLNRVGPSMLGLYGNSVHLVAILVAILWLGEFFGLSQGLGGLLVLGGIYLLRLEKTSRRDQTVRAPIQ